MFKGKIIIIYLQCSAAKVQLKKKMYIFTKKLNIISYKMFKKSLKQQFTLML